MNDSLRLAVLVLLEYLRHADEAERVAALEWLRREYCGHCGRPAAEGCACAEVFGG